MPLEPRIGKTLLRGLLAAARNLDTELSRCESLRVRELTQLKSATGAAMPRDLRGLLDVRFPLSDPLGPLVRQLARRVGDAAHAPGLESVDSDAGFAALRHLTDRVNALRPLVYKTRSAASAHGIHVAASSTFHGVERERFYFRYQVRISNESERRVRLLSRAWTIRDLDGRVSDVHGPGVVGVFPTLAAGESYEYSSGVPLNTPVGTQSGQYMFVVVNEDGTVGDVAGNIARAADEGMPEGLAVGQTLEVPVAAFSYRSPTMDGRGEHSSTSAEYATTMKRSRRKRRR